MTQINSPFYITQQQTEKKFEKKLSQSNHLGWVCCNNQLHTC